MSNNWRERAKKKATPTQLTVLRAKEAAKRRRARFRTYFKNEYGRFPEGPDDAKDVRRMMRGHPCGCICVDCAWDTGEESYVRQAARVSC